MKNFDFLRVNYLSSVEIQTELITISSNINETVNNSGTLLFAIPAAFIKTALSEINTSLTGKYIISGVKGMIPDDHLILADYFSKFHAITTDKISIITGPSHAEEIALERLSYLTVASENINFAEKIRKILKTHYTEISITDDIYGTEYAAVLKNIYAIASGICHGLGFGDNFLAVLISNAVREMKQFVHAVHPVNRDITLSAYLGDLLVTAYSNFSRNRIFGTMVGKGYSVKTALLEMNMIPEGYYALKSIHELIKNKNLNLPIIECMYSILYLLSSPKEEIQKLTKKLS